MPGSQLEPYFLGLKSMQVDLALPVRAAGARCR